MSFIESRQTGLQLAKRLFKEHMLCYKHILAIAVVCMIAAAGTKAANAYMMQPILDHVFIEKRQDLLLLIPIVVCVIFIISAASGYGQSLSMRYIGQKIIADIQVRLFGHLLKSDVQMFHDQASGRLISRFTNDIQMMRHLVSGAMTVVFREILSMIFLISVMIYQSWELTLVAFVAFPLAIYPIMKLNRRMRKLAGETQTQLGDFTAQLDEVFQGVRTVKAYGREKFESSKAEKVIDQLFGLYFKASRTQLAASPMMEVLSGCAIAGIIWYGGHQVLSGETTPGAFFSFIAAFLMAYRPVKALAGLNTTLQEGLTATNRLFDVLDSVPAIQDKPDATELQLEQGNIRFEDVTFTYQQEGNGVQSLTLDIPAGKQVALVGPSGGGKSTVMQLLLRFYDVESGRITVDGQDIRDVTQLSLREASALVPQETMLFDDTVRANIAYGKLDAEETDIIRAAKGAAAHEFITQLPEGYDTVIGPHGVKLSGGQRQRIAIARAMLKNAPILLLDEATSALDTQSERQVQEALDRLMEGRTTLMIAHRLSTIRHADIIYVLDQGSVVESGSHESLLAIGGLYARLYRENTVRGTL